MQTNSDLVSGEIKHTALPWHAPGLGEIHDADHNSIAQICFNSGDEEDDSCGTEADAEFIVRACNTHDDLVKALQQIVRVASGEDQVADDDTEGMAWIDKHARAALLKAGA